VTTSSVTEEAYVPAYPHLPAIPWGLLGGNGRLERRAEQRLRMAVRPMPWSIRVDLCAPDETVRVPESSPFLFLMTANLHS
jgi:hypothetical protein